MTEQQLHARGQPAPGVVFQSLGLPNDGVSAGRGHPCTVSAQAAGCPGPPLVMGPSLDAACG
jgi:hypothetical protein